MIRETLAANSSHAMADVEPSAGIEFIWRNGTGASADLRVVTGTAPNWVRLTRTNNTFTAYYSADGNTWTQIGATIHHQHGRGRLRSGWRSARTTTRR